MKHHLTPLFLVTSQFCILSWKKDYTYHHNNTTITINRWTYPKKHGWLRWKIYTPLLKSHIFPSIRLRNLTNHKFYVHFFSNEKLIGTLYKRQQFTKENIHLSCKLGSINQEICTPRKAFVLRFVSLISIFSLFFVPIKNLKFIYLDTTITNDGLKCSTLTSFWLWRFFN